MITLVLYFVHFSLAKKAYEYSVIFFIQDVYREADATASISVLSR